MTPQQTFEQAMTAEVETWLKHALAAMMKASAHMAPLTWTLGRQGSSPVEDAFPSIAWADVLVAAGDRLNAIPIPAGALRLDDYSVIVETLREQFDIDWSQVVDDLVDEALAKVNLDALGDGMFSVSRNGDGQKVITTALFWECECGELHPRKELICDGCEYPHDACPDADLQAVSAYIVNGGEYADLAKYVLGEAERRLGWKGAAE